VITKGEPENIKSNSSKNWPPGDSMDMSRKDGFHIEVSESGFISEPHQSYNDSEKKLRRRVEDRIRKDKEALYLVARVLNIK
jgi:hypothetical protein